MIRITISLFDAQESRNHRNPESTTAWSYNVLQLSIPLLRLVEHVLKLTFYGCIDRRMISFV